MPVPAAHFNVVFFCLSPWGEALQISSFFATITSRKVVAICAVTSPKTFQGSVKFFYFFFFRRISLSTLIPGLEVETNLFASFQPLRGNASSFWGNTFDAAILQICISSFTFFFLEVSNTLTSSATFPSRQMTLKYMCIVNGLFCQRPCFTQE